MLKKVIFILIVVKLFPHRYYLSVPPCLRVRLSQMFELLGIGFLCYVHRQERDICAVKKLRANFFLSISCHADVWIYGQYSGLSRAGVSADFDLARGYGPSTQVWISQSNFPFKQHLYHIW